MKKFYRLVLKSGRPLSDKWHTFNDCPHLRGKANRVLSRTARLLPHGELCDNCKNRERRLDK